LGGSSSFTLAVKGCLFDALLPGSFPRTKSGEDIRLDLEKDNIESRPLWKPMHLQPVVKEFPYYGILSLKIYLMMDYVCLPAVIY
jgi:hypothetical protein